MKKLFALAATLLLSVSAYAAPFQAGVNYTTLKLPESAKPTVTEFFSFYCPHCYAFEPIIQELKSDLPKDVVFQKEHVSFMGGSMGENMSKAYATMVELGVQDKLVPIMFNQIHKLNQAPQNIAELRQIFVNAGVSADQFNSVFNSFAVDSKVRRYDKDFKDSGLTGVPSVIVNNKYVVRTQSITSVKQYISLVKYLLKGNPGKGDKKDKDDKSTSLTQPHAEETHTVAATHN